MGRDIAWTWGPLFYLLSPFDIGNNLALGLVFQAAFWVLVIAVLWDLFFRGRFSLRELALFSVLIGLSTFTYHWGNLLLYPALILLAHSRLRPRGMVRYVAALTITGLIPLVQLAGTLIAVVLIAGVIADLLLRDGDRSKPDIALAVSVPPVVAIVCCRWALGSFRDVWGYVRSSLELTEATAWPCPHRDRE